MALKELKIQNLILVDNALISFEEGFTVISGETGSGKSAILEALGLLLGARADSSLIRQGQEKAVAEAVIELKENHPAITLLRERGIEADDPCLLILKRELFSGGKSRAYLNHSPVQASLLKEVGELLIEIVSQHASQKLTVPEQQRKLLDLYGALTDQAEAFERAFEAHQTRLKALEELSKGESQKLREIETCMREIAEIEEAAIKEGEEEELFREFTLLSSSEERQSLSSAIDSALSGDEGVLPKLKSIHSPLRKLLETDPGLASEWELYRSILVEVEELLHTIRHVQAQSEADPFRLTFLNDRLSLLNKLKRKYGAGPEEIAAYLSKRKNELKRWQSLDEEKAKLEEEVQESFSHLLQLADSLQKAREREAKRLEASANSELHLLNMPNASFNVRFTPQELGKTGAYKIEFFLAANKGGPSLPLKDSASGGELARVLLALELLLADKEPYEALIFDEIDSSIGGKTAALIGEKLRQLGKTLQVISITHFPQAAKFAEHHLHISKMESADSVVSTIALLGGKEKERELLRMAGEI